MIDNKIADTDVTFENLEKPTNFCSASLLLKQEEVYVLCGNKRIPLREIVKKYISESGLIK